MCGIIGIISKSGAAAPLLIDGLKRLAYRGYDSAGIATLVNGHVERRRSEGKIANLERVVAREPLGGSVGIGHTRWATHGQPTTVNAHPHADDRVVLVHNGIIENFQDLRRELTEAGHDFATDTDTEAVVHLVSHHLRGGMTPPEAVAEALKRIKGAFALAILFAGHDDLMIGARRGSPLAIGYGDGEMYLGSDALALAPLTRQVCYLEEGDWAEVRPGGAVIHDRTGAVVRREVRQTATSGAMIGKDNYPHFMLKEIYEQPAVIGDTLRAALDPRNREIALPAMPFDLDRVGKVTIIACGTSYHAGWSPGTGWSGSPRCRRRSTSPRSSATAGRRCRGAGWRCSSPSRARPPTPWRRCATPARGASTSSRSSTSRRARSPANPTSCCAPGPDPEIGVASTKAFTSQLATLACLAVGMAAGRGAIDREREARLCRALTEVPTRAGEVLYHDERIADLARGLVEARGVLFLGRGTGYPIALEGALKLKEISYIHAEGHAAGEMKHGPIALIDEHVPVIVIAPSDALFDKTASNMQEVVARGGRVIFLSDKNGVARLGAMAAAAIELPEIDPFVAPILYTIPTQLLAYHVAVLKGTDVDQPRNLAKSVTVE